MLLVPLILITKYSPTNNIFYIFGLSQTGRTVPTDTLKRALGFVLFSSLPGHLVGKEGSWRAQKGFLVLGSGAWLPGAAVTRSPVLLGWSVLSAERVFEITAIGTPVKFDFCLFVVLTSLI